MRYRDADHVDLGSFYARLPARGKIFRFLGYVGVAVAVWYHDDPQALAALLVCLILAWLRAWQAVVGTAFRSSLVAAALVCAAFLTLHRLQPPAPAEEPSEGRTIRFEMHP
jgi:hypothetical protein